MKYRIQCNFVINWCRRKAFFGFIVYSGIALVVVISHFQFLRSDRHALAAAAAVSTMHVYHLGETALVDII